MNNSQSFFGTSESAKFHLLGVLFTSKEIKKGKGSHPTEMLRKLHAEAAKNIIYKVYQVRKDVLHSLMIDSA